ncbi:MAG: methionine--tRNA ligase [Ruminococcaceae bacterium]|nr:methionine--tRNA ligase [Oscillospiraceae bacterium]
MEKKTFYITTAIAYASRKPHIGNVYDIVLADMIARYKRMQGFDVHFLTGSDEHGQKIEEYAKEQGISPKAYVDGISDEIKAVWNSMNVTYDRFIRTTDGDHEEAVKKIFKKLYDQGDIYKSEYSGKYCVPCESFFTESQLVDGKCPDCGREVIDSKEEAYFLKLSKYQDALLKYIEEHPDFIQPESRKNEMINNFLKPGLSDLCVSRSSFKWGVPVEFDEKHVIYVWIDALSNYITGLGYHPYNECGELYKKFWPADLHVIGKDIVRFHTIYWPIVLMALGEPLPKQVLGHPWVLFGEDKMSKSKGNVIYADELAARFGADAVRYYLLSQIPFAQDGNITNDAFVTVYNTDLANNLGNLVNRSIAMTNKYFGGSVTKKSLDNEFDNDLRDCANVAVADYLKAMDNFRNAEAAAAIMTFAKRLNKYIDETAPWVLAKDESNKERLEAVMYNLLEGIRLLGLFLCPIMPESSEKIAKFICSDDKTLEFGVVDGYTVGSAEPLFARLDTDKVLAELENERLAKAAAAKKENEEKAAPEGIAQIGIEDFAKVELKTAKVVACEPIPKAKKLLKLTLDDGSDTPRIVASGIAKWYTPDDLIGHTVIVVSNLKPAVLCGVESNGMILAADAGTDDVKVIFADGIKPGSKVR